MKYKRLKTDLVDIMKNPLNDDGIYYIHDDKTILKGYALMIGPKDTPYEDGFYFFVIDYPDNYPLSPPKVTFCNKDNTLNTRFNPNLYRNGKVCISILNTWRGEGWTSCLTIRSVLLSILTVLNKNPLINEPNIDISHREVIPYNNIITNRNINVCIYEILDKLIHNRDTSLNYDVYNMFRTTIIELFLKKYNNIINRTKLLMEDMINHKTYIVNMYSMSCYLDYNIIYENVKKIKIELEKL